MINKLSARDPHLTIADPLTKDRHADNVAVASELEETLGGFFLRSTTPEQDMWLIRTLGEREFSSLEDARLKFELAASRPDDDNIKLKEMERRLDTLEHDRSIDQ